MTQLVVGTIAAAVYSIADPKKPQQIGYFIPEAPRGAAGGPLVNDVHVDEKGLIYAADRVGGGLYILEYTGSPRLQ